MRKTLEVHIHAQHILMCHLSDGVTYRYDMSFVLREDTPMTKPLRDTAFFSKVFLSNGQLTWPNGYDIHAETVARDGTPLESEAS